MSSDSVPDLSAGLQFRRLPQATDLTCTLHFEINTRLPERRVLMRAWAIVNVMWISAFGATENLNRVPSPRNRPETHLTKHARNGRRRWVLLTDFLASITRCQFLFAP
jgi:hypothetical protein